MTYLAQEISLANATAEVVSTTQAEQVFREAWSSGIVTLETTAIATVVGDTLDVLIDTSVDNGVTWFNIGHFAQVLGTDAIGKFILAIGQTSPGSSAVADMASDLAAGATRQWGIGDRLRARSIVAGVSPIFSYKVTAFLK